MRAFAFHLDGGKCDPVDDDFFVILNAHWEPRTFDLPGGDWLVVVDTDRSGDGRRLPGKGGIRASARSVVVLSRGRG